MFFVYISSDVNFVANFFLSSKRVLYRPEGAQFLTVFIVINHKIEDISINQCNAIET